MKRWIVWLARAWPLWALVAIGFVIEHYATWSIAAGAPVFNKVAGALLQGLGALIVLVSLDGNLGLFRGQNLFSVALAWCRDYPRKQNVVNLVATATAQASASGALASVRTTPSDLEGRMAEIERFVGELEVRIARVHTDVNAAIADARREAAQEYNQHRKVVSDLIVKLEVSAIGGIKFQAFGVGLAVLGSVLSIYS